FSGTVALRCSGCTGRQPFGMYWHLSHSALSFSRGYRKPIRWLSRSIKNPLVSIHWNKRASGCGTRIPRSKVSSICFCSVDIERPLLANGKAQQPGRLACRCTLESHDAGPVWCSVSLGRGRCCRTKLHHIHREVDTPEPPDISGSLSDEQD